MGLFEDINAARMLLDLPERATMADIKSQYRAKIQQWHPDRCKAERDACKEMTVRIITAYRLISDYCKNYEFSFSKEEVGHYLSAEEWWFERFGRSPLWGSEQKKE
ncbi:MAG: J domain-containing protein [Desulfobacterales bacterium]